ncbi:MAG: ComEC/Rec2 family competence protein, partial [Candidatus Saccharimonadales bacterium]
MAWSALAMVGGMALAFWLRSSLLSSCSVAVTGAALWLITFTSRARAMVLAAIIAGLLLGLWRGSAAQLKTADSRAYIGQTVRISGTVADDVTRRNGATGLKLKDLHVGRHKLGGEAWASASTGLALKRGDEVTLEGKLKPGFGSFALSLSYARLVSAERPAHGDVPREVRDDFTAGLDRAVPEPQASLGIGYLTGQHNTLTPELTKQLQLVGLIHVVIAGGYNVTILARLARRASMRHSKRLAMVSAGTILLGQTLIAGFTAPMARTFVVASISLMVWYYGRKIHPLVLLPVAAAITAVVDPSFVWGDVGWYMTFVAYGGLIMLGPMLKQLFWHGRASGEIK